MKQNSLFSVRRRFFGGSSPERDLWSLVPRKSCPRTVAHVPDGLAQQPHQPSEREGSAGFRKDQLSAASRFAAISLQPHAEERPQNQLQAVERRDQHW